MIDTISYSEIYNWVLNELQNNEWFKTVGFFGLIGAIWQYGKGIPGLLWERIRRKIYFSATVYEMDDMYGFIDVWLRKNYEVSYRNVEIQYSVENGNYRNNRITDTDSNVEPKNQLSYKQLEDHFFIWRGIKLIKIFKGRENLENASDLRNAYLNRFEFSGFFSKKAIWGLLKEIQIYNESLIKEEVGIKVKTNDDNWWRDSIDLYPKDLSSIIVEGKEGLISDVVSFSQSEEWYAERAIPYRRGYLLYGDPGNGKTSLVMSIAKKLNRTLHVITISESLKDNNLISLFSQLPNKSILLFEDVDAIFDNERNVKSKFNFSTLLNCLDGAFSKHGTIVFMTTNLPEKLDYAMLREGRMDYKFEISNPSDESASKYLRLFYEDESIKINGLQNKVSMVAIQNACMENKENYLDAIENIKSSTMVKEELNQL